MKAYVEDSKEGLHSIGEVAKMCKVSRKTLCFYEELGLLTPDYICPTNGYRYYSDDTIMLMPILKYYKQMGFKLQEMSGVGDNGDYFYHERNFLSKINELKKEEQHIANCRQTLDDWLGLIHEGSMAIENNIENVSVKYINEEEYYYLDQDFEYDYKASIINVPWTTHLEENNGEITGPVILEFSDYQKKAMETANKARVMQKPVKNSNCKLPLEELGGKMFLCSYHIGHHASIATKYYQIEQWAKEHNYECGPKAYERYVVDYWTTNDVNKFVTEVMIPAEKM